MIKVTERYALKPDEYNYQLWEYRTIDPTKAANWNNGIDKNGKVKDATIRTDWVALQKYYPTSNIGLAAALQEIAHREVREGLTGDIELQEYVKQLYEVHKSLQQAVEGAINEH